MSRKRQLKLLSVIIGICLLAVLLFAVYWFAGDSDRRAEKSRIALQDHFTPLSLPGLHGGEINAIDGCNGLDFNDCETYVYTVSDDGPGWTAQLQKAFTDQGFTVYPHSSNEFQAFNNSTAMYIQVERDGNQVTIIVGEASNGPYAPK